MDELYNAYEMPLSSVPKRRMIQEKILKGENVTNFELVILGCRDHTIKSLSGYRFKPDHVYRAISEKTLHRYELDGYVFGNGDDDEFVEQNNNAGVDWYLGGVDPKYGNIVIECPAYKKYFVPSNDNGCGMTMDPFVRHMKSSGSKNPVPFDLIVNVMELVENVNDKSPQEIAMEIKQIREEDELFRLDELDNGLNSHKF